MFSSEENTPTKTQNGNKHQKAVCLLVENTRLNNTQFMHRKLIYIKMSKLKYILIFIYVNLVQVTTELTKFTQHHTDCTEFCDTRTKQYNKKHVSCKL